MSRFVRPFVKACCFFVLLIVVVSLVRYRYADCKRIGHSTFYCVLDSAS